MNAFDRVKLNLAAKSPRLAILAALAKNGITTLDDLQTQLGESRKKLQDNLIHIVKLALATRMRDDVTHFPAYQITQAGRKYLEDHESDVRAEPKDESKAGNDVITPSLKTAVPEGDNLHQLLSMGALNKKSINEWESSMMQAVGEHTPQKVAEAIAGIKRQRDTLAEKSEELKQLKSSLEHAHHKLLAWLSMANVFNCDTPEQIADRISRVDAEWLAASRPSDGEVIGYALQRPAKVLIRFRKEETAKERAMSCARKERKHAKVLALTVVGEAVPGAEWRES